MRLFKVLIFGIVFLSSGYSQTNHIYSGGEAINFGIIDISTSNGTSWSSERSKHPGYFSAIGNANFIGYSDKIYIDGYVKKYGNTSFVFPVGNGNGLRTLEISKPNLSSDTYATAWIEGDPTNNLDPTAPFSGKHPVHAVSGEIIEISKAGQWDWLVGEGGNLGDSTTGNGVGISITVNMPDMSYFSDKSDLRLAGWNGKTWIDLSGKPTATGNKKDSKIHGTMIAGITAIAIGKTNPAPFVKIKSLAASMSNCKTILNWETSFEDAPVRYYVERSFDGIVFETIKSGDLPGSKVGNKYRMEIEQPNGICFYRLKFQNTYGSIIFSGIVSAYNKCNTIEILALYPNPVTNKENITLRFKTLNQGRANLTVYNTIGQNILNKQIEIKKGINAIEINVQSLVNGAYYINITDQGGNKMSIAKKFIKQ